MSKVDLLLINPSAIKRGFLEFDFGSNLEKCPPLGLAYLASSCKNRGYKVAIIDLEVEHLTKKELIKKIKSLNPRLIGITCISLLISKVIGLAHTIKKNFDIPIVLGGPHASIDPDSLLERESINFLIRGEGEESIVNLIDYLTSKGIKPENINNLSYKKKGKIVHNPKSELKMGLDEYPFPDRSLLKNHLYFNPFTKGKNFTSIVTSRGCVYDCIICNPQYKKFRKRSVKNVINEIKKEIAERKIYDFEIYDETFNLPPKWVIDFCDEITRSGLKISFRIRCRPDLIVSEEMIKKLKMAGCHIISLGIESINDRTLKFLRKAHDSEQVRKAIRLIKKANIDVHGYFILGIPIESKKSMLNTIKFALKSKIDIPTFSMLVPMPGTEIYRLANENGWWEDHDKLDYAKIGFAIPSIKHPELTKKELKKLYRMAYVRSYFRWRTVPRLIKLLFNYHYLFKLLKRQLIEG